jgi:histidine kinase
MKNKLGFKLFVSYAIIVVIFLFITVASVPLSAPGAYNRHMMMRRMEGQGAPPMDDRRDFANFRDGLFEALMQAAFAASLVAVGVSFFFSRSIVAPLRAMTGASQRIAEGHYDERVTISGADEIADLGLRFNSMAEKLEQTESMRRQLIGDVSHELRTPLTAIKGSMEGLIDGVLPNTPETFEQIRVEADRLSRLVDDLQELSRVESGAFKLDLRSTPIARVIETAAKRLSHQFAEKQVELSWKVESGLVDAMIDEDRILQVLINLAGNALQYTPPGGSVAISASSKGGHHVQVSVRDTGIGIDADHLAHIFDRFYRVDKSRSRSQGGSGIGLTIVKRLVEAHDGKIFAESDGENKGSVFTFTLPK